MTARQTIFLTGATGYIGGSVLWRLLHHKDVGSFRIRALVRDATKAKRFNSEFGVEAVVGTLSELPKLQRLASESDFVITTADINDFPATKAILKGLKERNRRTGTVPSLIQTSGTGVLDDDAAGMYTGQKIYNDLNVEEIEALPFSQPHREVDSAIVQADEEGYVKTHIVFPSCVYGIVKNGFTEAGLQNPISIQVPGLIRASLDRKQAGMVGLGKNIWPNVHIDDQADLYITIFNKIRTRPETTPHGRNGFFFAEAGEHSFYDLCRRIAEVLFSLGKAKSPEPSTFSRTEFLKYFGTGPDFYGSNSRCIASRSRALGWNPTHSTRDLMESVEPEIESILASEWKHQEFAAH